MGKIVSIIYRNLVRGVYRHSAKNDNGYRGCKNDRLEGD